MPNYSPYGSPLFTKGYFILLALLLPLTIFGANAFNEATQASDSPSISKSVQLIGDGGKFTDAITR